VSSTDPTTPEGAADGWLGAGWSTGVGSMPGTDPHEAATVVAGEVPDLPHLVELPARGPGADLVGRSAGLLTDLHVDLQPSGWRLVDRPGTDERRAHSYLSHDLDELEGAHQGRAGAVKVQVCGPWTLAAALRLPRGEPVLADAGAVRDLVQSLTDGTVQHLRDVRRRLPRAPLVLQVDEPSLPAVLAGGIRSSSGARSFSPVPAATVEESLRGLVDAVGVPVVVHCCADRPPVATLVRAGASGLSLDLTGLGSRSSAVDDELGEAVDGGVRLLAGVVPSTPDGPVRMSDPAGTVEPVRRLWRRLGLPVEALRQVVVTPTCGLAGASPDHARAALRLAAESARQLAEDPEG
jgi:methionine synthase II (cobalamin-independent)